MTVVINRPGLTAHTSTGYYDEPYYSMKPLHPPLPISVEKLEQLVASSRGESDGKLSEQLSGMELTERLSEEKLARLDAQVRGKRTQQALRILADSSVFLDPPANEISAESAPAPEMQQHILALTSEYLSKKIRRLPNFFARETMVRYQETPEDPEPGADTRYQPLHLTGKFTSTVYYRDGEEIIDVKTRGQDPQMPGFTTYGVFGPVLEAVFDAIDKSGGLTWSHWEQSGAGRAAVFRYVVPPAKSPYWVRLCCLAGGDGTEMFQQYVGYHGELAVDPESGAVLRLEFKADLTTRTWVTRAEVMVRYGRVEIGGESYICPLRSVSVMRVRSVQVLGAWNEAFRTYGPYVKMLDDDRFDRYHIFEGSIHMLPGFTPVK